MMKRKLAAIAAAAALVFTSGVFPVFANETDKPIFSDIKNHWARSAIEEAVSMKLAGGYPDGTFLPDHIIKREEFYTLIGNILTAKPDISDTKIPFSDVDPIEWYVPTIKTAVAGKVTSGYPDGTFGIGRMMTRQEAAQAVYSIISHDISGSVVGTIDNAKDKAQIDDWARNAINMMYQKGYMKGDNQGNFRPTSAISRAEAVQLLLQVKKNESVIGNNGSGGSTGLPKDDEPIAVIGKGCTSQHLTTTGGALDTSKEALEKLPKGTFMEGNGTESQPYEIDTPEQLSHMREHNLPGAYFKLMKDIEITNDLAEVQTKPGYQTADWRAGNFEPVGTKEKPFVGVFDGNSHTISGLRIDNTPQEGPMAGTLKVEAAGLFSYIGTTGKVKALRLSDMEVRNTGSYTGAIAGYCQGTINDCSVESSVSVSGKLYTGGLAGYSENEISDCTSYAEVSSASSYTGGIVGYFYYGLQPINRCYGRGEVNGTNDTGGIAGAVSSQKEAVVSSYAIQNSFNYGTVNGQNGNTGGIVGRVDGASGMVSLNKCVNRGTVQGSANSGGITGYMDKENTILNECGNLGTVKGGSAGGIVGMNEGTVQLCLNTGSVEASNNAGGIVGVQSEQKAKTTKCYNEGEIGGEKATSNAGGIAGQSSVLISYCYNTGNIYGTSNAGGLVGKNSGRLLNVYNTGDVDGDALKGSISGRNQGSCTNGFWLGGSAESSMGGNDSGTKLVQVIQVTEEQLTGEQTVRIDEGDHILDALNSTAKVFTYIDGYDYPQLAELT